VNVLAQILSSKVRSGIFRLLFGTEIPVCRSGTGRQELHLREIERKTGLQLEQSGNPVLRPDYMGLEMDIQILRNEQLKHMLAGLKSSKDIHNV